jgi:hypothetical protein
VVDRGELDVQVDRGEMLVLLLWERRRGLVPPRQGRRAEEAAGGRPSRAGAPLRPAGPGSPSDRGPPPSSRDRAAAELRTASRDGDDGQEGRFDF